MWPANAASINARQPGGMGRTFGRGSSQPIHSQLGPTLGGHYWVGATRDEMRGDVSRHGTGILESPSAADSFPQVEAAAPWREVAPSSPLREALFAAGAEENTPAL